MKSQIMRQLVYVTVSILYIIPETFADPSLVDVAALIANLAYKRNRMTSLVWRRSNPEYITEFSKRFHGSLLLAHIQNNNNSRTLDLNEAVVYKQTVLFADSAKEFAYFITMVNLNLVVPIRVLLILTKPVYDLSEITRTAWDYDVADILILKQNELGDVMFYTYFPYNNEICGDFTPVKLNVDSKDFFPRKFTNFYGCPIKLTLLEILPYVKLERKNDVTSITGMDGSILMFIIERVNASVVIVSSSGTGEFGSNVNGTWTGSFGDLVNRHADIFVPAGIINRERYLVAQMSHVYETLDVYWFAPNRREIYTWAKVFFPLFTNTMPFTCLTFAVFVIVTVLLKRFSFHETVTKDSVFFQAFIIFLGQDAKFETRSVAINGIFMLWVWFCLIVRIEYQGDLVNGLQKTFLEPHLRTLDEAIKAVDAYGGSEIFRDYYRGTSVAKNYEVIPVKDVPMYIKYVSNGKRFLLVADIFLIRQFRGKVQVLNEPVIQAATCIFMRPGWPASLELDGLIFRMIETGFVKKLHEDNKFERMITQKSTVVSDERKPLNMSVLSACFYGLMVLWIISFIVFILEIILHKYKDKRKLNNINLQAY